MTTGYAIQSVNGLILIRTVSDTRRAAIVNFLVAKKKQPVYQANTDADIENMWAHHGRYFDCIKVNVTRATEQ